MCRNNNGVPIDHDEKTFKAYYGKIVLPSPATGQTKRTGEKLRAPNIPKASSFLPLLGSVTSNHS